MKGVLLSIVYVLKNSIFLKLSSAEKSGKGVQQSSFAASKPIWHTSHLVLLCTDYQFFKGHTPWIVVGVPTGSICWGAQYTLSFAGKGKLGRARHTDDYCPKKIKPVNMCSGLQSTCFALHLIHNSTYVSISYSGLSFLKQGCLEFHVGTRVQEIEIFSGLIFQGQYKLRISTM